MNQTIKKIIEIINKNLTPDGLKKTSSGIFPADWETSKTLGDIGVFDKGRGLPGDKMSDVGDIPCIGYGDIYTKYNYHFSQAKSFTDEETAQQCTQVQCGDLLFTGTGETAEEIGKCVCYNGKETIYAGGDIIIFRTNEVNPLFLAYQQYCSFSLRKKAQLGQGHSVVHIHDDNLRKLPIAFPKDKKEQEKIAQILMKWDEAIELQEQMIDSLINRKERIMMEVLKPKNNWKKIKLGEICKIKTGKLDVNAMVDGGEYPFFTCAKTVYTIDSYSFDCEALLIAGNGDIGDIKYYNGKFDAYQRTYVLFDFTYYAVSAIPFRQSRSERYAKKFNAIHQIGFTA